MTAIEERTPPARQARGSQFVDASFLLVLLFLTLFVTTFVLAEDTASTDGAKSTPISQLDISPAEKKQFETMKAEGLVTDETASALVEANAPSKDKYPIAWGSLMLTVALAVLYLGFVYAMSFREYREVVVARFGRGDE